MRSCREGRSRSQDGFAVRDQDKTKDQLVEELTELRRCLDALVNNLPEGFFVVDGPDARIRLASRDAHQMFGVSRGELEGIEGDEHFRYYQAFHPNGDPARLEELPLARAVFSGEVVRSEEWLLQVRDGERFPILCHAGPVRDQQGNITGGVISWQNLADRKRAEEALRKAHDELEQRVDERAAALNRANEELAIFRKFADASGQGFSMADLDGRLMYLNPALCRMLGDVRPEDYVGRHLSVCYSDEANRRGREEIEPALKQNGYWEGELPILSRQGKSIPTWQHSFTIRDDQGNPLRLAVVITDITERKAAEEALAASEERFRAAFEEAPVGMVIGGADGLIIKVNRAICEMTGFRPEDMLGHHGSEFSHPEDTSTVASLVGKLHSGEVPSITTQVRHLKKNGGAFWTEMTAAGIRGPGGSVPFGLAIVKDITERKRAQEALEQERQTLWRMLQASDHERQIISYDIHDGLAQYLAGAGMQFQAYDALRESQPDEAKRAYQTAVELVRQAHFEARRLISEVRPPVIDEIGLETAMSHLVHEQRRHGGPKIEFHSAVQFDRLPQILENALYRIVQEALTNACMHSKSNKVTVAMAQEEQEVRLKVQDWGIGFDPESVASGHFGLEGIRQRVRLLGGRLTLESTPGSGTLVQVVVPILERQADR
jgi:PAS domain S-box-containing protein